MSIILYLFEIIQKVKRPAFWERAYCYRNPL